MAASCTFLSLKTLKFPLIPPYFVSEALSQHSIFYRENRLVSVSAWDMFHPGDYRKRFFLKRTPGRPGQSLSQAEHRGAGLQWVFPRVAVQGWPYLG